jgi:tetratricopeptide (TPR) repeat protein
VGGLLAEMYDRLPELRAGDDDELWAAGADGALRAFRGEVRARYTEGTLQRVLAIADDPKTRRAAALALGLTGTLGSAPALAAALHDADPRARRLAADSLWQLWFAAGTAEQCARLRDAVANPDATRARAELDDLVRTAPAFAEARNQRAIWFFKRGEFARAVEDCEAVLHLNPHHFGAAAGMGQCLLKLNKPRAALRAFRRALEINPDLDLYDTVRALEEHGE